MKKSALLKQYEDVKDREGIAVCLEIHMPDGETEVIFNPNAAKKMEYIDATYSEDLVHKNSDQIYITSAKFIFPDNNEGMGFEEALELLKDGAFLYREGWNGPNQCIGLHSPDEHSEMTKPFLYITTADGDKIPWLASQTDLLADDWKVVEDKG